MSNLGIQLDRPLVFFDLETTGTHIQNDRIVEIGMVKIMPDGDRIVRTKRFNPQMPIPPEVTAIHGISDEDVKDEPPFSHYAGNLASWLENCDLGGYNLIYFDIPMLIQEMKRAGVEFSTEARRIVDSFVIFRKMCPRDLSEAVQYYCNRPMENAHSAEADILATVDVFEGQLKMYHAADPVRFPKNVTNFPKTLNEIHEFCNKKPDDWIDTTGKFRWSGDKAIVGFGAKTGTALEIIARTEPRFLQWMVRSDFPKDAVEIARNALMGKFPVKNN